MHQFRAQQRDQVAELFVYGDIGGGWLDGITAKDVAIALQEMGDVDEINVRINSYGGIASDGTAIMNLLARHPASVLVDVEGYACSAASVVAMAGETIRMATGSLLMIHDAWGAVSGNYDAVTSYAEGLKSASQAFLDRIIVGN